MPERETGERPFPPPPQLPPRLLVFFFPLALLDFLARVTILRDAQSNNSNLPLTRNKFCFPSDHFHINLPSITRTMFRTLKKSEKKNSVLSSKTLILNFPSSVVCINSLLVEADVVCHKSNVKQLYFSKQ